MFAFSISKGQWGTPGGGGGVGSWRRARLDEGRTLRGQGRELPGGGGLVFHSLSSRTVPGVWSVLTSVPPLNTWEGTRGWKEAGKKLQLRKLSSEGTDL